MLIAMLLGSAIGAVMALSGAGGGILAVPLLTFGLGLNVMQAAPIGLFAVGMAAWLGAFLSLKAGLLRYRAALLMAAGGVVLAPVGIRLAGYINSRWLSVMFASVLLLVAWRTYCQVSKLANQQCHSNRGNPPCVVNLETGRLIWTTPCTRVLALYGCVAGLLSGMLGVGGGFIMVPVLSRYTDLAMQSVIATSLGVIALVSVSGVAFSAFDGRVMWNIALPFSVGGLFGMLAGRWVCSFLAGERLQLCYAIVAGIVGITMIAKAFA